MPHTQVNKKDQLVEDTAPEPDSPVPPNAVVNQDDELIWQLSDNIAVEHIIAHAAWADHINDDLKQDLAQLVSFVNGLVDIENMTLCCRWTDDADMRQLNNEFRQKDKATNVLSFPDGTEGQLGDLAFGFETMMKEAEDGGMKIAHHIRHLLIHGLLHLSGFDHLDQDEAEEMEALEISALALIGIDNPYQGELAE